MAHHVSKGCLTPFYVDGLLARGVPVACGKCPECCKRRIAGWSFRLLKEFKVSSSAYFITLTYDSRFVPITPKGQLALYKPDFQLFIKRLRKANGAQKTIKYYAVGEYGERLWRPHYHAIVFNLELSALIGEKNANHIRQGLIALDGKTKFKSEVWSRYDEHKNRLGYCGHVTVGEVNAASVGYCLEYMSKRRRVPAFDGDDRQPEFGLMSKGLGAQYVESARKWHRAKLADRLYCVTDDGHKVAMPRYYKDKLYNKQERQYIGVIQAKRLDAAMKRDNRSEWDKWQYAKSVFEIYSQFKKLSYEKSQELS